MDIALSLSLSERRRVAIILTAGRLWTPVDPEETESVDAVPASGQDCAMTDPHIPPYVPDPYQPQVDPTGGTGQFPMPDPYQPDPYQPDHVGGFDPSQQPYAPPVPFDPPQQPFDPAMPFDPTPPFDPALPFDPTLPFDPYDPIGYAPPDPPGYFPPDPPGFDPPPGAYTPPEPPGFFPYPDPPGAYVPPDPPGFDSPLAPDTSGASLRLGFALDESATTAPQATPTGDGSLVLGPFPPSDTAQTVTITGTDGKDVTITIPPHDYAYFEIVDAAGKPVPADAGTSSGSVLLTEAKILWDVATTAGPGTPSWLDFSRFFEVGPARAGAIDALLGLGGTPPTDPADRAEWDRGQNTVAALHIVAMIASAGEIPTGPGGPGGFGPEPVPVGGPGGGGAVPAAPAAPAPPAVFAVGGAPDPAASGSGGGGREHRDPPPDMKDLENRIAQMNDPQLEKALHAVDPNDPDQVRALGIAVEIREAAPVFGSGAEPGLGTRDTPGGPMPQKAEAGIFAHDNLEALRNICTTYDVPERFRPDVQSGRIISIDQLPNGLSREVSIGVTARVDRVGGVLYEVKPNTDASISAGMKQLDDYVRLANASNFGGRNDWTGKLVVYDAAAARKFIP
jgi:hypothetical protein